MNEALADEIVDAYNNTGGVVKKKKKFTVWLKPTVLSRTCAGNFLLAPAVFGRAIPRSFPVVSLLCPLITV